MTKYKVIRVVDDKPETIRFQRKYVVVEEFIDGAIYGSVNALWSTFDSSTGEYYFDDPTKWRLMLWDTARDLRMIAKDLHVMDRLDEDINYYTREILEYANS